MCTVIDIEWRMLLYYKCNRTSRSKNTKDTNRRHRYSHIQLSKFQRIDIALNESVDQNMHEEWVVKSRNLVVNQMFQVRFGRKPSSVLRSSLSLSKSNLMFEKPGLPGRMLKLMLDIGPVVPSSYSLRAASYSIFSCSACARNGCA